MAGKYEQSFVQMFNGLDDMVRRLSNEHHIRILLNYRRHGLLEVSQRWQEILAPDMSVAQPRYQIEVNGQRLLMNGRDEVARFYDQLSSSGAIVLWPTEQVIAVADWGFASESTFFHFLPGAALLAQGEQVEHPQRTYLEKRKVAMIWHYDQQARMIGEHVYEMPGSRELLLPDPDDVISPARARELLAPLIDNPPVPLH